MKPVTYRSYCDDGEVRILDGYPTGVPGLLVSRPHPHDVWEGFSVVHARSGNLVIWEIPSPEAALVAARDLGCLDVDWTRPGPEMQEYIRTGWFRTEVHAIAGRYDGLTMTGPRHSREFVDNGVIA